MGFTRARAGTGTLRRSLAYDFVHIPGDDAEHTIFYIFALSTWGLQMFTYYRAYRAFDAHNKRTDAAAVPTGAHVAA